MNSLTIKSKGILHTVKEAVNAPVRRFNAILLSMYAGMALMQPTLCVTINKNITMEKLFGGIAELIIQIAFWIGAFVVLSGALSLFLAYKDDNGMTRSTVKSCCIV